MREMPESLSQDTATARKSLPEPPAELARLRSGEEVIDCLQTEHRYMQTLLSVLQLQIDKLEQGLQPDYALMSSVVDSLDIVSHTSRHRRENLLFARLATINPEAKNCVDSWLTAHEAIERKTENLLESLKATIDSELPRNVDQVRRQANDYLKHLKKHLTSEERLYALIEERFSPQDWQVIIAKLHAGEAPVFGKRLEERYRQLYAHLQGDLQQRAEDYTVAEFLSLGAFTEMLGSIVRNSSRLGDIASSGFREMIARDRTTMKRLLRAENRNARKAIALTLDCMLDDYDTWVEKLAEAGLVFRDVRNEVAESYRSHEKIYQDVLSRRSIAK